MNILVVDDEELIRDVIKEYLSIENYTVVEASDGLDAIDKFKFNNIDLVIMDIMMPNMDGFNAIKRIKEINDVPTIMLSARADETDKLEGFDLGIDDYITKPFSPKELIARVKAVLKRNNKEEKFIYKTLEVDYKGHIVKIDNKEIKLTPKEYEILCFLIQNKNIAMSRETLLSKLWGYSYYSDDRTIDTHIKKLRSNLGQYRNLIITVRSMGYKFVIQDKEK